MVSAISATQLNRGGYVALHPQTLPGPKLIMYSGYLSYSALSPLHMGLSSISTYQIARTTPASFPKRKESSSTNVPSGNHILQCHTNGQKANVSKHLSTQKLGLFSCTPWHPASLMEVSQV